MSTEKIWFYSFKKNIFLNNLIKKCCFKYSGTSLILNNWGSILSELIKVRINKNNLWSKAKHIFKHVVK